MIFGHSILLFTGALVLFDWFKFKKQKQRQSKQHNRTIKLCITGGPCGGKSQGINCLYNTFQQVAAPFFIVPEAATIIGSAGLTLDFSNFDSQQIQLFQIYLMRLQYNLEMFFQDLSKTIQKLGKCPVILCDRGLLDGKAYAGKENWDRMLKKINITESEINQRYKAVIHMQTAARGARQSYFYVPEQSQQTVQDEQMKGNKVRKQAPEVAIQLDQKIQDCYNDHPMRFVIRNYFFVKGFEMKKVLLIAQVNQIIQFVLKRTNLQAYYQEYERNKFARKMSAEEDDMADSPYLIRKRKYKKFLKKQNNLSP